MCAHHTTSHKDYTLPYVTPELAVHQRGMREPMQRGNAFCLTAHATDYTLPYSRRCMCMCMCMCMCTSRGPVEVFDADPDADVYDGGHFCIMQ